MKRRWPFLVLGLGGVLLWRGGFGFLPVERTIVFRPGVSAGEVRSVELQVWDGAELLKREAVSTPKGLVSEPTLKVPLRSGSYRFVAVLGLADGGAATSSQALDVASAPEILLVTH